MLKSAISATIILAFSGALFGAAWGQQLNERTGASAGQEAGMKRAISKANTIQQERSGEGLSRDTIFTGCAPVSIGGDQSVVSGGVVDPESEPSAALSHDTGENGLVGTTRSTQDVTTIVTTDIYNICKR
ncbi:MAG: hypothetical protein AAGI14_03780 [Pseudomonadota bacterium]